LTMAAVYLWVVAADAGSPPGARTAALAGMTLALAAAICSNYFAALAFVTIAAGEAVRTATREDRRVDWRVWAGLAVAASPLLAFRRLMQSSVAVYAPHAWNKVAAGEAWVSYFRMAGSKPACVMAALMAGLAVQRLRGHAKKTSEAGRKMAAHEAAAAGMLLAYPLLGYGVARVYGGMFSSRFVIPVCLGLATAGMVAGYRLLGRTRVAGLAMLGVIATGVGARWKLKEQENVSQKQAFNLLMKQVEQGRRAGEPVVVTDAVLLLPLQQYASPAMAAQMVLPVDFAAVHRHQGDDGAEENLWAGRNGLYPLRMVPLAEFQRTAGSYLIVGERENWLVQELRLHQYPVERVPFYLPPDALRGYLMGLWRSNTVLYRSAGDAGGKGPVGSAVAFEDER